MIPRCRPLPGVARLLGLCFTLMLGGPCAASAQSVARPEGVGRWERFERIVTNAKRYPDPYRDVELHVTYTRPDGGKVTFFGFHDGGDTWRIRFMPDRVGTWHYDATFSDGAPGVRGTFTCVASSVPGMIAVHAANPIWFGYKGGNATTLRALHIGDRFFARNWDDTEDPTDGNKRAAFLDWAQAQGYNTLSIASHYLSRNTKGRGAGWDTPALWPLNAAEFRRMERMLDDLARRQIVVFPFAGFFGRDASFPSDHGEQSRYLRYCLARLAPYWNLLFNVAGPEPRLKNKPFLTVDDIHRLGAKIARHDPFGHPLSVHNPTGDDQFKDAPWLTFGTLQGPKTLDRRTLATGVLNNHHAQKPLFAQETLWSGNMFHMGKNKADYSDADLRKSTYVIHFSGGNLAFADNDGDSSSGFTGTLELTDRKQRRHDIVRQAWDQFASLPFAGTKPAPDLVSSPDTGVYGLAEPGRHYLVYLETRGTVNVRLSDGPYEVEWINAQDARDRRRGAPTRDGAGLRSPVAADDWILHLFKKPL